MKLRVRNIINGEEEIVEASSINECRDLVRKAIFERHWDTEDCYTEAVEETVKNTCCFYDPTHPSDRCTNRCDWEIHDRDDPSPENDTYSCNAHLASMVFKRSTVDYIGLGTPQPVFIQSKGDDHERN